MKRLWILLQLVVVVALVGLVADNLGWLKVARGQATEQESDGVIEQTPQPPAGQVYALFLGDTQFSQRALKSWPDLSRLTTEEQRAWEGHMHVFDDSEAFYQVAYQASLGDAIYFDKKAFDMVDPTWLRKLYQQGVAVGAIEIQFSALSDKLGIKPEMPDLRPEFMAEQGITQSAMAQAYSIGNRSGSFYYADYLFGVETLPFMMNGSVTVSK